MKPRGEFERLTGLKLMLRRAPLALLLWFFGTVSSLHAAPPDAKIAYENTFTNTVKPFLNTYCVNCHSGAKAKAQLDLSVYSSTATVVRDYSRWTIALEKLSGKEMPPEKAKKQPTAEERDTVVKWIDAVCRAEARNHAGDPGDVPVRRLSNAEYNYTIRDLTGADIQPTKEFPVDPANQAGFDNSGESLDMSPTLLKKYLDAAREVANHMVLKPDGNIAFAPFPALAETDRDKYCVNQIVDFYRQQDTDYADYFQAAWRFKNRKALGKGKMTLTDIAAEDKVSAKYLATVWQTLQEKQKVGPVVKLQTMWRALPAPKGNQPDSARAGCEQMRDFVKGLRAKLEPRFPNLAVKGLGATSQPFLMWKNRQYATHRMTYDHNALQIDGKLVKLMRTEEAGATNEFGPGSTPPVKNKAGDPDLFVPAAQRAQYEAAFAEFCAVFPDNFYISERGRNYFDKTKDQGRLLSAGFHNLMGYFRDDQPLYQLVLDDKQQKQLDEMWHELDFIASANIRTYVQFYFNESGEARGVSREAEGKRPSDKEVTAEAIVRQVEDAYLTRVRPSSNAVAIQAIEDHFNSVNDGIRWVEHTREEAAPKQLESFMKFAERAYRRPLAQSEKDDLLAYYQSLRKETGLDHEEAMRDMVVDVLMSPDFCYRLDLIDPNGKSTRAEAQPAVMMASLNGGMAVKQEKARPLSDYALANRLSYFIWASMPDEELMSHARAGDLHKRDVLLAQTRRMLKDPRARDMAVEFGGNWLDFRRFEEINTVDRERFPSFDSGLRSAMFEEPIRFMVDVINNNRSALDFLYGKDTFVNLPLAQHYGMTTAAATSNDWVHVADATPYGRGGLLPMAVFLTKNAPGLRTSPVKRGYWVVKRVLGEQIPPPPAVVPELPHDEAKMDLPLRQMLAKHREDPTCASCHARFDSFGLVFEGYGPVGDRRAKDMAGRPVDDAADFPGGAQETGVSGLRDYIHAHREKDFVDNLCRKMLAYGLGRTLILSDEPTVEEMRTKLAANGYRFDAIIESIVTTPQFLDRRVEPASNLAQN
jgi:mono/diheme cytochrome c family protein